MASNSSTGSATYGGNGYTSSFAGDFRVYGSGGGGGGWSTAVGSTGGTYSGLGGNSNVAGTGASMPNSGAGGSGGGDGCKPGGAGASGVVILRYVAATGGVQLAMVRNAMGSMTGSYSQVLPMQPVVAIRTGTGAAVSTSGVTITASGTGVGGTTTAVTDSTGTAYFKGLATTSATSSISFVATGYSGISQTMTNIPTSSTVTVSTAASSGGYFDNGLWVANTDNAGTVINATDLLNQINTGNDVAIQAKGAITYNASITSDATTCGNVSILANASTSGTIDFSASSALKLSCSNKSITIVSNGYIKTAANVVLQTTKTSGATLVLWADQDRAQNAGGIMTFGQGTFLNTSGGATTTSQGTTGAVGGGIWIAGGTSGTDGYPSGYALGNASGEIGIDLNSASGSATVFCITFDSTFLFSIFLFS
jgi:hypothetical protein